MTVQTARAAAGQAEKKEGGGMLLADVFVSFSSSFFSSCFDFAPFGGFELSPTPVACGLFLRLQGLTYSTVGEGGAGATSLMRNDSQRTDPHLDHLAQDCQCRNGLMGID